MIYENLYYVTYFYRGTFCNIVAFNVLSGKCYYYWFKHLNAKNLQWGMGIHIKGQKVITTFTKKMFTYTIIIILICFYIQVKINITMLLPFCFKYKHKFYKKFSNICPLAKFYKSLKWMNAIIEKSMISIIESFI